MKPTQLIASAAAAVDLQEVGTAVAVAVIVKITIAKVAAAVKFNGVCATRSGATQFACLRAVTAVAGTANVF